MTGNGKREEEAPELVWMSRLAKAHVLKGGWPEKQYSLSDLQPLFTNGLMEGMLLCFFEPEFVRTKIMALADGSVDPAFFMRHHSAHAAKVAAGDLDA